MKKLAITTLLAAAICVLGSGCASIVDGGNKTVHFQSTPPGAKFTIYDKKGDVVHSTTTPASVSLKRSGGYFSGIEYKVVFETPGYYPGTIGLKSSMDGWYWGNLLFGGLIGFLIVDPATGDMYTLPKEFHYTLVPSEPPLSPADLTAAQLKANPPDAKPPKPAKETEKEKAKPTSENDGASSRIP